MARTLRAPRKATKQLGSATENPERNGRSGCSSETVWDFWKKIIRLTCQNLEQWRMKIGRLCAFIHAQDPISNEEFFEGCKNPQAAGALGVSLKTVVKSCLVRPRILYQKDWKDLDWLWILVVSFLKSSIIYKPGRLPMPGLQTAALRTLLLPCCDSGAALWEVSEQGFFKKAVWHVVGRKMLQICCIFFDRHSVIPSVHKCLLLHLFSESLGFILCRTPYE